MGSATPQTPATPLPVTRACDLPAQAPEHRWLIRDLWAREGVGLIGGNPKVCKSWVGLEIAVSLASATPCLGRFQPADHTAFFVTARIAVRRHDLCQCLLGWVELVQAVDHTDGVEARVCSDHDRGRRRRSARRTREGVSKEHPFTRQTVN